MTAQDRSQERSGSDAQPALTNADTGPAGTEPVTLTVESRAHGWRLDHYLSRIFSNHSRVQLQRAIEAQQVTINGLATKPSRRLRVNDRVHVELQDADDSFFTPEDVPIDVLYEDDAIVVVNKPANMVVHPGRGSYSGTLAAALQFHFDQLSDVPFFTRKPKSSWMELRVRVKRYLR